MAERKVTLLVCDEPVMQRGNGPCEKPAVATVALSNGTGTRYEKDLCEMHYEKYFMHARRKNASKKVSK